MKYYYTGFNVPKDKQPWIGGGQGYLEDTKNALSVLQGPLLGRVDLNWWVYSNAPSVFVLTDTSMSVEQDFYQPKNTSRIKAAKLVEGDCNKREKMKFRFCTPDTDKPFAELTRLEGAPWRSDIKVIEDVMGLSGVKHKRVVNVAHSDQWVLKIADTDSLSAASVSLITGIAIPIIKQTHFPHLYNRPSIIDSISQRVFDGVEQLSTKASDMTNRAAVSTLIPTPQNMERVSTVAKIITIGVPWLIGLRQICKRSKIAAGATTIGTIGTLFLTTGPGWSERIKNKALDQEKKADDNAQKLAALQEQFDQIAILIDELGTALSPDREASDTHTEEEVACRSPIVSLQSYIQEVGKVVHEAQLERARLSTSINSSEVALDRVNAKANESLGTSNLVTKLAESLPMCRKVARKMPEGPEKKSHLENLKELRGMVSAYRKKGSN